MVTAKNAEGAMQTHMIDFNLINEKSLLLGLRAAGKKILYTAQVAPRRDNGTIEVLILTICFCRRSLPAVAMREICNDERFILIPMHQALDATTFRTGSETTRAKLMLILVVVNKV